MNYAINLLIFKLPFSYQHVCACYAFSWLTGIDVIHYPQKINLRVNSTENIGLISLLDQHKNQMYVLSVSIQYSVQITKSKFEFQTVIYILSFFRKMSKAGNVLRRSGVVLKSLGSTNTNLQLLINQLKETRYILQY